MIRALLIRSPIAPVALAPMRLIALTLAALTIALPARAIDIQQITSPGGIRAWLVEAHDIPFISLDIAFKGGASLDAAGKRGAINLMATTLEEGAGDMDSQEFAAAQESLAAQFGLDLYHDSLEFSARMLSENRDKAVDLLRAALTAPHFDQSAIDRVRAQVLSIIASYETDPYAIATKTFLHMAYGDHPYGSPLAGTEDSVTALTREDLFDAKARVMARDRMVVSVVGDITPDQLGPMLDHLLGELPETGAPMPPEIKPELTGGITTVPFDTPQSVVIFGQPGIAMTDPDFFPALVFNQIIGAGGLSSRLMDEVREKRGLTYGVASYLVEKDLAQTWEGGFASANSKVAKAIRVVQDQWRKAATGAVTDRELQDAKTYLTGAYPLSFDGNGWIAGILTGMQLSDLPIDYIASRNDKVNAVTRADIERVARRIIKANGLRFVVVGQPVGLD